MPTDAPPEGPDVSLDDAEPIHVPTGADYVSDRAFADFPVSPEVLQGVAELGYVHATPVQAVTIEPVLAGRHLLVRAKTGTGKTAAFCVPIVEVMEAGARRTQAIVLAPTRELAQQIGEECAAIAKYRDLEIAVLVGGLPMVPQEEQLARHPEIVVGTPGRILDHLRRRNLDLSRCGIVVLDEADEMLSMGFFEDVTAILDTTPAERQVLLFSATISDETQRLADRYLRDPENIRLSTDADNVEMIEHVLYDTTPDLHKIRALLYLIDIEDPTSAIIFCNTREDTATVASFLDRQGLDVQLLSGELSQARRSQVMKKVKAGEVTFLVSTDVAARGIDISDLSHVINYSLPPDPPVYLHRVGRTGRIGKRGTAISLVGGTDLATRKVLESRHGIRFDVRQLPAQDAAVKLRVERQARQIRDAMSSLVFESYLPTVQALKARPDGDALLAAALRAFFRWDRQRRAAMSEVDSISDLIQQRNEKIERKERRGGRDEQRRERGGRRERGERGERGERSRGRGERHKGDRPAGPSKGEAGDLDALLVSGGEPPANAPNKKKRRRRKKKDGGGQPLDDLDSFLTSD